MSDPRERAIARAHRMPIRRFASAAEADRADTIYWQQIPEAERALEAWRLSQELWRLKGGPPLEDPVKIYNELADWFHLLTHPSDYAGEATDYVRLIHGACPNARTLLELGAGGGNNASHMKQHFTCTLTDLSPRMLEVSRSINPDCEHIQGDMRELRLGRLFDAVFVHDAVEYMTSLDELSRAVETAFVHTRPGGVALFVPDGTRESFAPSTDHGGHDGPDGRAMRYLEWTIDPDPRDTFYDVHFACLLKEGDTVRVVHDHHRHALFTRQQWLDVLESTGFVLTTPPLDEAVHETQVAFLGRRPQSPG